MAFLRNIARFAASPDAKMRIAGSLHVRLGDASNIGEDALLLALVTRDCDADVVERVIAVRHINHAYEQVGYSYSRDAMRRQVETFWGIFKNDLRERPGAEAEWRAGNAAKWMRIKAAGPALRELARAIRLHPLDPANARWIAAVSNGTVGCQPRDSRATAMSGQRRIKAILAVVVEVQGFGAALGFIIERRLPGGECACAVPAEPDRRRHWPARSDPLRVSFSDTTDLKPGTLYSSIDAAS